MSFLFLIIHAALSTSFFNNVFNNMFINYYYYYHFHFGVFKRRETIKHNNTVSKMNASILSKVEIIIVKLSRIGVIVDFDLSSKLRIILCTLLLSCVCNGLRLDSSFSSRGCCKITPHSPSPHHQKSP